MWKQEVPEVVVQYCSRHLVVDLGVPVNQPWPVAMYVHNTVQNVPVSSLLLTCNTCWKLLNCELMVKIISCYSLFYSLFKLHHGTAS